MILTQGQPAKIFLQISDKKEKVNSSHLLYEEVSVHSCYNCPKYQRNNQEDNSKFLHPLPYESK